MRHLLPLPILISVLGSSGCGGLTLDAAPEPSTRPDAEAELPAPRAGADLLGTSIAGDLPTHWIDTDPVPLSGPGAARATLIRFWTDTCPFCTASLPALDTLRQEFEGAGLATVAVYHPKPPRPVDDIFVAAAARERGYLGPVAVDADWSSLNRIWLAAAPRSATSASFLVDDEGVVRFVHPGPEFHPSDSDAHALCDADFRDLRAAITALIAPDAPDTAPDER